MKKNLFTAIAAIVLLVQGVLITSCETDTLIDESLLPQTAQDFISQWFPGIKITSVLKDIEGLDVDYEVILSGGQQIEFDRKGNWTNVDCGTQAVPAGIIPVQIATLVDERWPDTFIVEISHDSRGWDVELSNGLELEFNRKYVLRELDD